MLFIFKLLSTSQPTKKTITNNEMFCKVCKDAGKTEAVYTSHWIRDAPGPNGKVICPTLLNQTCKYCKENGHTPKHCTKLQRKYQKHHQALDTQKFQQRAREMCSSPPPREQSSPAPYKGQVIPNDPMPIGKKTNYFNLLMVDDDEDADIKDADIKDADIKDADIKDADIKSYKKDLEKNFPALGQEKTMKIVNALFPTKSKTTKVKSYSSAATATPATTKYKREDSPTPSPISSRPHSPPNAPKKMPVVKEDHKEEDNKYIKRVPSCDDLCMGTLSPSPSPSPPPPTMTMRWADME